MTGFALVRKETAAGELTVSLRTVNHRGLDLHFHHNGEIAPHENAMRALLKTNLNRGHVEVRTTLNRAQRRQSAGYNRTLLETFVAAHRQAAADFGLESAPDLNVFFQLPGALTGEESAAFDEEAFGEALLETLALCLAELNFHREREGGQLVAGAAVQLDAIEAAARAIVTIRAGATDSLRRKLEERLWELLGSQISPTRLMEEAAVLAERSDIEEELTRLTVHTEELRRMLATGGELGKRLDFLLQEMNREANTILSKTSGIGETGLTVTNHALAVKANIEKIREQSLNLE